MDIMVKDKPFKTTEELRTIDLIKAKVHSDNSCFLGSIKNEPKHS